MRRLGAVQNVLRATINLGAQIDATTNNVESTKPPSYWGKLWNEQDVRIMVLISLALQLFLLFAGNVRRRRRVGGLTSIVWLAYLSAYAVAGSAISLFSQYEDKYKIRKVQSPEDLNRMTIPFLWAPFLLIHLGGPDTITAFSIEDNNLWTRQLLNLVIQLSLALYVFWKSHDLLDSKLRAVAIPLFVAGIIKYGEKIWALKRGSRDEDGSATRHDVRERTEAQDFSVESNARNSALYSRALLAGRTLPQMGLVSHGNAEIMNAFKFNAGTEEKLEFVLMELGMIYDMLYTKVMVLQGWTGVFRCVALVAMVVAFVLFWANQHMYAQRTTNAAITYTLFVATICVEIYSILTVIASTWTSGRSRPGGVLWWLSHKLAYCFPSGGLPSLSMGQFNLTDYCWSKRSMSWFISKVSEALSLDKHWRNFWYVKHIEDKEIVDYVVGFLNEPDDRFGEKYDRELKLGEELHLLLTKPFDQVLFLLHIFTEMHLSAPGDNDSAEMTTLVAQCRKLSNYLMYLMALYPSMLPVSSSSAHDRESHFAEWVKRKSHARSSKEEILKRYVDEISSKSRENKLKSPFKGRATVESLMDMKEMWARLLIYAAGKCPMELHARQLGDGVELLTVIGSLMVHQGLGNMGLWELNLVKPPSKPANVLTPLDAFVFSHQSDPQPMYVRAWRAPLGTVPEKRPTQHPSQMNTSPAETYMPLDIEQTAVRLRQMGLRLRAVSGAVQPPQGQIQRSLSLFAAPVSSSSQSVGSDGVDAIYISA